MAVRDLVVLLDGSRRDAVKLAVALELTRQHDAHLTGFCALEALLPADMAFALGGYPDLWALPDFARQIEEKAKAAAAVIERNFRDLLSREGIKGEWELEAGPLVPSVVRRGQTADLLIVGQSDPDNPPAAAARMLIEDVLITAGRPLLLIPYAGIFDKIGRNALIGWTPTREATRAVHDALALFEPSGKATILTVETAGSAPAAGTAAIAEHLTRHGLTVAISTTVVTDGSVADALLDYAADISADLLVVGGYGHSRTREMVMGGATRDLLRNMTLPVLMSH